MLNHNSKSDGYRCAVLLLLIWYPIHTRARKGTLWPGYQENAQREGMLRLPNQVILYNRLYSEAGGLT